MQPPCSQCRLINACTLDCDLGPGGLSKKTDKDPLERDGPNNTNMQQLFLRQGVTQAVMVLLRSIGEVQEFDTRDTQVFDKYIGPKPTRTTESHSTHPQQRSAHVPCFVQQGGEAGDLGRLAREPQFGHTFDLATLGWRFVRQACKGYPPAGAYVVDCYCQLMLDQMPYGLRVMDAMVEVFRDNREVNHKLNGTEKVSTRKTLFQFAINNVREIGPVSKFVDFLANMVSDEANMHTGEEQVMYANSCSTLVTLLEESEFDIILGTRLRDGKVEINSRRAKRKSDKKDVPANWVRLCDMQEDNTFSLPEYLVAKAREKLSDPEKKRVHEKKIREPKPNSGFHVATLRLFTRLCVPENIVRLRRVCPLDLVLAGVHDEDQQVGVPSPAHFNTAYLPVAIQGYTAKLTQS